MKKLLSILTIATFLSCSKKDEISRQTTDDIPQVQIGNQIWMKRNLDVSTYRNGDTIPQITDPTEWVNLTTGAWCYYDNNPELGKIYGKLYNWYAVIDPRGLAPEGWKVPSDSDFTILSNYLGGDTLSGGKLKSIGTYYWVGSNIFGTDDYGFGVLPGGSRGENGTFCWIGCLSLFRTSDTVHIHDCDWNWFWQCNSRDLLGETINPNYCVFNSAPTKKDYGLSVRCLKN